MTRHSKRRLHLRFVLLLALAGLNLAAYPALAPAQTTTIEEERAREERARADRMREAERQRELDRTRLSERERVRDEERTRAYRDRDHDRRHYHDRPGEMYVAGFGGYTIGHSFSNIDNAGVAPGTAINNSIGLKNSGVYGIKVGYFLPNRLNWLGFEVEGFNTTPHFEQSSSLGTPGLNNAVGSHLRVTTVAFNVIGRAKMWCDRRHDRRDWDARRASRDPGDPAHRDPADRDYGRDYGNDAGDSRSEFCRLQPYVGVGVGLFFAEASNNGTSSSDNAVPGFNGLAGIRYYFTEHVAMFGEYKYNRATFNFDNVGTAGRALNGDYSVSHVVGGLSFHF